MIQSTIPLLYDARNGQKSGIIEIAIISWTTDENGITYTVRDYAINEGVRTFISEKPVPYSWEQLNSLNEYLKSIYNYSGMNKQEIDFAKVKHGLLLETQARPVYGSTPQVWVLTENVAA